MRIYCKHNPNLKLNACAYDVQFTDRSLEPFNTNVTAENLYSQVDAEGNEYLSLKAIVHHLLNDDAVKHTNERFVNGE